MNVHGAARLALGPLALAGVGALGLAALAPVVPAQLPASPPDRRETVGLPDRYPADSLAAHLAATDPFRLDRRPAPVKYDPQAGAAAPGGYAPPRPELRLVGLVQGPTPLAAIAGLPGVEGDRLLGVGQQAAGFRVVAIESGRVRVAGQDTVWVLTLRRQ